MKKNKYSSIESIISISKKGGMYILVDDENRENEGDLVFCASDVNSQKINFMAKYGRGLICLTLNSNQSKRLGLNYMAPVNQSRNQTAFTISIEAKKGISTGISAKDRARTVANEMEASADLCPYPLRTAHRIHHAASVYPLFHDALRHLQEKPISGHPRRHHAFFLHRLKQLLFGYKHCAVGSLRCVATGQQLFSLKAQL